MAASDPCSPLLQVTPFPPSPLLPSPLLAARFAVVLDIHASRVAVSVTAASVLFEVTITLPTEEAAIVASAALATPLGNVSAASAFLGVTVMRAPLVEVRYSVSPLIRWPRAFFPLLAGVLRVSPPSSGTHGLVQPARCRTAATYGHGQSHTTATPFRGEHPSHTSLCGCYRCRRHGVAALYFSCWICTVWPD